MFNKKANDYTLENKRYLVNVKTSENDEIIFK